MFRIASAVATSSWRCAAERMQLLFSNAWTEFSRIAKPDVGDFGDVPERRRPAVERVFYVRVSFLK